MSSSYLEDTRRRLAAVLVADVVGYSRLMGRDDVETARMLAECRDLARDRIRRHGGRVADIVGDSILAEFPSVVAAVRCAIDVQHSVAAQPPKGDDAEPMRLRIGVHLGDVLVRGRELFGDGINVAARLQALAEPGGICISRAVHDQIHDRIPVRFEDMGEQEVKNIARPIGVFGLPAAALARLPPELLAGSAAGRRRRSALWLGVAAVVAVLMLATWALGQWWLARDGRDDIAAVVPLAPGPAAASVGVPVLVIQPFTSRGNDPAAVGIAERLSDGLVMDLFEAEELWVVDAATRRLHDDSAPMPGATAAPDYLLRGTVGVGPEGLRIDAELLDVTAGHRIWTERYVNGADEWEQLRARLVSDLLVSVSAHARVMRETEDTPAAVAFLRGWHLYQRHHASSDRAAIASFERALALDPGLASAHAALAAVYWRCWLHRCHRDLGLTSRFDAWDRAEAHLREAMQRPTSLALRVASDMRLREGRHEEALALTERAVAQDPSDLDSFAALAEALTHSGRPLEALSRLAAADARQPSALYLRALGLARFATARFAEAAHALERAIALAPADQTAHLLLIAAYGHLGRNEEAALAVSILTTLLESYGLPFTMWMAEFDSAFMLPADRFRLLEGLRSAGVPG